MLKKEAREITGGLSKPSKMPGPAHNLPAAACKTGAISSLQAGGPARIIFFMGGPALNNLKFFI